MNPGLGGGLLQAQQGSDLPNRISVDIPEHDRRPICERQGLYGLVELRRQLPIQENLFRIPGPAEDRVCQLAVLPETGHPVVQLDLPLSLVLAEPHDAVVHGDSLYPGPDIALLPEGVNLADNPEQRVLEDLFGVGRVLGVVENDPEEAAGKLIHEGVDDLGVQALETLYQVPLVQCFRLHHNSTIPESQVQIQIEFGTPDCYDLNMRTVVFGLSFLVLSLHASGARGQAGRRDLPRPEYERSLTHREDRQNLIRAVFRNGLTLLIEEHPAAPLASVVTHLRGATGAPDDRRRETLLSELLLNNEKLKTLSFEAALKLRPEAGLTGPSFVSTAPAAHLEGALKAHAHLLDPPAPTAQELERAVAAVQEQDRMLQHSPRELSRARLLEGLLPGVGPATRAEDLHPALVRLHRERYHPSRLILSVSGAVLRNQVLEHVARIYGSRPAGTERVRRRSKKPESKSWRPSVTRLTYHHMTGKLQQAHVLLGYSIPGLAHPDHEALLLLAYLLGQGKSSLLHQRLVQPGTAVWSQSRVEADSGTGLFWVSLAASPGAIDRVEVETLAVVEDIKQQGITPGLLNRAKALLVKDFYRDQNSLPRRAVRQARMEAAGRFWQGPEAVGRIQSMTPARVREAASKYLKLDRLSVLEYYPATAEKRTFSASSFQEMLDLLVPPATLRQQDSPLKSARGDDFAPVRFQPRFSRPEFKSTSILRGPSVYFQEEHTAPLVHLGVFFPGGRIQESAGNAGITELMVRSTLRQAVEEKGELRWYDLELMGTDIQVVNELDFFGLRCTALSRHLPQILEFLINWYRESTLDKQSLHLERQQLLAEIRSWQDDDRSRPLRRTRSLLYGSHPYGLDRLGTWESVSRLELQNVDEWLRIRMQGVHPWIFILGDIEGTSFLDDFISQLANSRYQRRWAVRKDEEEEIEEEPSQSDPEPAIVEREGVVMVGLPGPSYGTRDSYVADVWKHLLLSPQIRDLVPAGSPALSDPDLHFQSTLSRGALFASVSSIEGREKEARRELLALLSSLPKVQFSRNDVLSAIVGAITHHHALRQDRQNLLLQLALKAFSSTDSRSPREYVSVIRNVTPSHIRSFANRYFPGTDQGGS